MHARCLGMLADDYDAAFADALAWDDRRPMPFERARTQLAFGRRLNRERRRAEARVQLRAALDRVPPARCRAVGRPVAQRAARRQRAAAHPPAGDPAALTPQEVRVAAAASCGGSTRDIAAEMFLAPKTAEFHLGKIYRKLGVRSRAQMIAVLADSGIRAAGGPGQRRGGPGPPLLLPPLAPTAAGRSRTPSPPLSPPLRQVLARRFALTGVRKP